MNWYIDCGATEDGNINELKIENEKRIDDIILRI